MRTVYKKQRKNSKKQEINYICKNELDKVCFQRDIACRDFKDLAKRTASDKFLRDKAFNIAKNSKYDRYQRRFASMIYKSFDKKLKDGGFHISLEFNEQLAK